MIKISFAQFQLKPQLMNPASYANNSKQNVLLDTDACPVTTSCQKNMLSMFCQILQMGIKSIHLPPPCKH